MVGIEFLCTHNLTTYWLAGRLPKGVKTLSSSADVLYKEPVTTMPFIEIHYLEPRSQEQREKLAKAITDDVVDIFRVPREAVWIRFDEMPQNHFSKGGVLWNKRQK